MPHVDEYGLTVTLQNPAAVATWNATVHGVLAHAASTPCALSAVREEAPEFALGHAMRGLCCMILARGELVDIARHDLDNARKALDADPATERERLYVDALAAWLGGSPSQAVHIMDRILVDWPRDALALKIGHSIRFMMGDPEGMRRSVASVLDHYDEDHPARGYALGCHAFALEETGDMTAAEAAGKRALEFAPDDAWGLHAVDHVYDMTARAADGIKWITDNRAAWDGANNFRFHLWWHLALHHLELGEVDRVLELYDTEIRRERTDDFRDISNGTSLLARLEIEGVDVGTRWEELAEIAARRVDDASLVFANLHYLMALLATGRKTEAGAMINRLAADAARSKTEMETVARAVGFPAAEALSEFWSGHNDQALQGLLKVRPHLQAIGGSHAQRDVFERITIEAAVRAGRFSTAEALIADRDQFRGASDRFSASRSAAANASSPAAGTEPLLARQA
ncbi:MAG: tetratricopeptide repeat protein [Rhizobiales bacterium]|nr:tetratricopeptide repeat protein [Hyphomicrobiales bacterium]